MDADEITPGSIETLVDDQPDGLLEQLAAKRQEIAETKETFIPIPGYDQKPPLLLANYRLLEGPELAQIGEDIRASHRRMSRWDKQLQAAVLMFDRACVGIYVDKGDGQPVPLTWHGRPISGYTIDLAEALRFLDKLPENPTHSDVIFGLFAGNDLAVSQHSFQLNRWFGNTSIDVSEDFLGNL